MTQTYRIRPPETWAQARADYAGGLDAEAVCRRYGLGLSNFRRRAREEGWRRADQADPAPEDDDLTIYDDVDLGDQIDMARLRYIQALDRGRVVEAARWRTLWRELKTELWNVEAQARIERDRLAHAGSPRQYLIQALDEIAGKSPPAENLHDLHASFPSAESADAEARPLTRAERRRREREARRLERRQNRNASTVPTARPPDTTAPPAMA